VRKLASTLPRPWPLIATVFIVAALGIAIHRYIHGLGSVTHLTNQSAWGLWIGIDVLSGVGLAAGGFLMASAVYVFGLEKFRPIVRMSILTAFMGYLIFIAGLLVELGRPWYLWHCIVDWNFHSPLFEVAWCVMLYTTVLALEMSQVVFDKFGMTRMKHIFHRISVPLIITGAVLSTLHQSSLGTLFTAMPSKMDPLWYSPILPVLFFASCIAAGLAMVIMESFFSERFLNHRTPGLLLISVSRALVFAVGIYGVLRFEDIVTRGSFRLLFAGRQETFIFWIEAFLFVVIPLYLLIHRSLRETRRGLFWASLCVVLGFLMHRVNITTTAFGSVNQGYFPSWQEIVVSIAFVMAGFSIVGLVARNFPVLPDIAPQRSELPESVGDDGHIYVAWNS
jgi:Ni/Fe-hydrogenase subunit HybB-like protein